MKSLPPGVHHLHRALKERGCPICRLVRESEERWAWNLLYELTGDPEIHQLLARSLGLCPAHGRLLVQVATERELVTPTGVARLYETVVAQALAILSNGDLKRGKPAECPLCRSSRDTAARQAAFLAQALAHPDLWTAYERSEGLCLPHFTLTLMEAPFELRPRLLSDQIRRLQALLTHLREFQRKERYDVREAPTQEELSSFREAVWRLAGVSFDQLLLKRE